MPLLTNSNKIAQAYLNAIMRFLRDELTIKGGSFADPTEWSKVSALNQVIAKALKSTEYAKNLEAFKKTFPEIENKVIAQQKKLNGVNVSKNLFKNASKSYGSQIALKLDPYGINFEQIVNQPVIDIVLNSIVGGGKVADLEAALIEKILESKGKANIFEGKLEVTARDISYGYQGAINTAIANEYGMNAYRYVGSLIEDSRKQCVRWVGKEILLFSDLQSEIEWAFNNGTGMNKSTTPDTFAIYRGGYNCRHEAIPTKVT